jgi:hypothetical protein
MLALVIVALVAGLAGARLGWLARGASYSRQSAALNAATQGWIDGRYRIEPDGRDARRYDERRYEAEHGHLARAPQREGIGAILA